MKNIFILLFSLVFSALFIGCSNSGGEETDTTVAQPTPPLDESSGGVIGGDDGVIGDSGDSYTFSLSVFVTGEDGTPITGLDKSSFVASVLNGGDTVSIDSVVPGTVAQNGAYSAALLLDQSGSMRANDPFDLRIRAAKEFFNLVNSSNNAALFAFAGSGDRLLDDMVVPFSSGYVTSIDETLVDTLKDLEGGWSPLFDSSYWVLTDLLTAPNGNRALILLSDGENEEPEGSSYGGYDVTNYANANGITIHTIGLSEGADVEMLSFLATDTGGSYTLVQEASQLNSAISALAAVLRGDAPIYELTIVVNKTTGTHVAGDTIEGQVRVTLGDGTVVVVPFVVTVV